MKKLVILAVAFGVTIALAPQCWAQRGQGRGAGGFNPAGNRLMLLNQKSVQDELKLSDEQTGKITALAEKQRGSFASLRDLSQEERQKKIAERNKENETELAGILKDDQLKRLKQISLQQQGGHALSDPEVATALNLTSEQKEKVASISSETQSETRGLFQEGGGAEARTKIDELRKKSGEQLLGVLSADQQSKWKELTGEPFKGEIRRPQGGGNRPGAKQAKRARA